MENELTNELKAIGTILDYKPEISNNPFSVIPTQSLKDALKIIEEYQAETLN